MKKIDFIIWLSLISVFVLVVMLPSCATEPYTPPYTLTYHDTQSELMEARASYGIISNTRINGFWVNIGGKDYIHILQQGWWKTGQTLRHEERHVREGQWH